MTTSISNPSAPPRPPAEAPAELPSPPTQQAPPPATTPPAAPRGPGVADAQAPRTVWSRFIILLLCLAVVTTTLAFGTVHAWSLAAFQLSAALVVALWMLDAWRTRALRVSKSFLQVPLVGLALLGLVQLLPLGAGGGAENIGGAGLSVEPARALSFDPYATRLVLIQLLALFVYFAAALAFIDSPRRLRLVVRTVVVFGFVLALFGLMQNFISPNVIYWVREPKQAQPFGPYINRHHFAGYMELVLAMPLGLLFSGAIDRDRVPLYGFAALLCAVALVMTNSRGGIIAMVAEILFLVVIAAGVGREGDGRRDLKSRVGAAAKRVAFAFVLLAGLFVFALYSGGEQSLTRFFGTASADDPTTGRAHFWKGAVEIIKDHPVVGAGLGAFSAVYPRYDTGPGAYRLEQAHNDYLQILTDGGAVGALLALVFVAVLFRQGFRRLQSHDKFRRGVALGALTGCAGVLVHSLFDFTLHTTANGLLFLLLAALATINGRVEEAERPRRRRVKRRREGALQQPSLPLARGEVVADR